jgi:pimeloyl-ACP methyl ester carboxylesterase
MQVSNRWLRMSNCAGLASNGLRSVADLKSYNADFMEWGSGPPLVLVPGLAGGIALVEPLAIELSQHFRVIALELRGENDCFALRQRFGLNDLADDLAEFIAWRGIERPTVVGISFGGVITLTCAARYPGLFEAIGVQGVGLRFESGLMQRIASAVLANYPLPEDCPFVNQFFNVLFGGRPTADQLIHATRSCWQTDQSVMTHRLSLLRRFDFNRLLPEIFAPTLLISGSRDAVVSGANARGLVNGLADCHQTVLPRAGHLAPVSHTTATADALGCFFAAANV